MDSIDNIFSQIAIECMFCAMAINGEVMSQQYFLPIGNEIRLVFYIFDIFLCFLLHDDHHLGIGRNKSQIFRLTLLLFLKGRCVLKEKRILEIKNVITYFYF